MSLPNKALQLTGPQRAPIDLDGCTPAMEAGIADHIWTIEELMGAA